MHDIAEEYLGQLMLPIGPAIYPSLLKLTLRPWARSKARARTLGQPIPIPKLDLNLKSNRRTLITEPEKLYVGHLLNFFSHSEPVLQPQNKHQSTTSNLLKASANLAHALYHGKNIDDCIPFLPDKL